MAEAPTRKVQKGRTTDKAVAEHALSELERKDLPATPQAQAPAETPRSGPGFFTAVLAAMAAPLVCGVLVAVLIWLRYWPPLPGLMPGWLAWCMLAAMLPLAGRKLLLLAPAGAVLGGPVLALTLAVNFKVVRVEGESMYPTLLPGDVLLVDLKGSPRDFALPGREIYVVEIPGQPHQPMIKRLAATPGQTLSVKDGRLYADGELVFPPPGLEGAASLHYGGYLEVGMVVGEERYFFVGDNPPASHDSRRLGTVSVAHVGGRVVWRLKGPGGFGRLP
ncbi:MAG: signal peptidase I [Planctomycetaceae bacterium]|nr:hypothetical protein [Planctomycetota bacterium]NUO17786.1 signal peptidase I [Planctomycetaceae bacterium]